MFKKIFAAVFFFITASGVCFASPETLRQKIKELISDKKADIAVTIIGPGKRNIVNINEDHPMPMQSVYKFHIALAILDMADKGKFSLDQKFFLSEKDLPAGTHSPLREKYPLGAAGITLEEILRYTVSESDNNGCDFLLRLIGGPEKVNAYIRSAGIENVNISATEREMSKSSDMQYSNSSTSLSAALLLQKFYSGKLISKESKRLLLTMMTESNTGENRIKGLLPPETEVAHKTGSGLNKNGTISACNDIGIVTMPNGKHFIAAIFITGSEEDPETNEKIIAETAKAAWDHFVE